MQEESYQSFCFTIIAPVNHHNFICCLWAYDIPLWGLTMLIVVETCSRVMFSQSIFGGCLAERQAYSGWGTVVPCFYTWTWISRNLTIMGSVPLVFGMIQYVMELWITTLSNHLNNIMYIWEPFFCLNK